VSLRGNRVRVGKGVRVSYIAFFALLTKIMTLVGAARYANGAERLGTQLLPK
jgi:hypothetical protein